MPLQDQLNTVNCDTSGIIGSGLRGCPIDLDNVRNFGLLKRGTIITDFTRESLRQLQIEGKYIPLLNGFDTTWNNEENQVETAANSGLMSKGRDGLYNFTATFNTGLYFQKVIKSLERGNWDMLLIDDAGTVLGYSKTNDELRGFTVQMLSVNAYTPKAGATSAKTSMTVQLANPNEMNMYAAWLTSENYDFIVTDVDGVNQVELSYVSGLEAGSTSIVVRTVLDMDNHTFVGGLETDNFLYRVNGTTQAPTAVEENPEDLTYTLTVTELTAEDTAKLTLYNTAENTGVIEVGGEPDEILYQSKEIVGVATA